MGPFWARLLGGEVIMGVSLGRGDLTLLLDEKTICVPLC